MITVLVLQTYITVTDQSYTNVNLNSPLKFEVFTSLALKNLNFIQTNHCVTTKAKLVNNFQN